MERVYRAFEAIRRQDFDSYAALHDPDCEVFPRTMSVEGGTPYRGHDGLWAYWSDLNASFTDWFPDVEGVRDFGDTVMVKMHSHGRGRGSGVLLDEQLWVTVMFRDSRAVRWAVHETEAEALEAVGLSE